MISEQKLKELLFIDRKFPWMGKHSGYDVLIDYLAQKPRLNIRRISGNAFPSIPWFDSLFSFYARKTRKSTNYDRFGLWSEISAAVAALKERPDLVHVLYVESHFLKLPKITPRGIELWGTAHQPPSLWMTGRHDPSLLEGLDHLIVLSSESQRFFEEFMPGDVHFIPHGVDIDFFCPESARLKNDGEFRCVFSGKWLRDLDVLEQVIAAIARKNTRVKFDLIVPTGDRQDHFFSRIAHYDAVSWHADLTDERLRDVYRNANLLLLPLIDCTANNALLEGIACGLPIISNDVGGVKDYTDQGFAVLLPSGDARGMIDAILSLEEQRAICERRGQCARRFAVERLSWEVIAKQHLALYSRYVNDG